MTRMKTMLIFAILFIFAVASQALAGEERSYEQLSPSGKYLFVMLAKGSGKSGKVDTLKKEYKHSGMYRANELQKSLWRINWYSAHVHVSSDGIHLVRIGRAHVSAMNAKPNTGQLAIAFYASGSLTKKYTIGDLFSNPAKLVKTPAGFKWQKRIAFDDASEQPRSYIGNGTCKNIRCENRAFDSKRR